ncbi:hypothetical protein MOQ_004772 [Trypanosoma cruzi marinkellei]|uniref:Uncharacterized protein n=1 Tax=Trypanosoma cruzi marinkellei TaxID=85056 RepID=K2N038_TRYCR|nr:hypothetical protein MOQ_004772 [Trypanosoma cruzi marinkellei]
MPNRAWKDPLEACYDTELFDALLGTEESSSAAIRQEKTSSVFSNVFMVGGSLFSRRRTAAMARSHGTRLRGVFLSWLDYGSIYCPFTRQFVSLRSAHWSHLVASGFGIDSRLRHGRCVVLVRPEKLERLAYDVQQCQMAPNQPNDKKSSHPLALWSPLLQESLGGLLQTMSVGDSNTAVQRVREFLSDANCTWTNRRIPLSFYDLELDKRRTLQWAPGNEKELMNSDRGVSTEEVMKFGESYLHQCLQWRASVLQKREKITSLHMETIARTQLAPVTFVISPPQGKATALIEKHSTVNVAPFLVPNSRMAYLSLTYNPKMPLLEAAVTTIVGARFSEETFYCPLEHCVDYSTLMDVQAYRLRWSSFGTVQLEESTPLLHLGMHMDPSKNPSPPTIPLVVIGNAHLLSKRAITRLLEQWTRNGLAWNTESRHLRTTGQSKRELLLRKSNLMRTVDAGALLFGNVHALFVGYSSSCEQTPIVDDRHVVVEIQGKNAHVSVLAPVPEAMFCLEEPLAAALKRVARRFQESMNATERTIFIEELCDAMSRIIVPAVEELKEDEVTCSDTIHRHRNSGVKLYELEEEDMLFLLKEACEAFLTEPAGKRDVGLLSYEQLLCRYPKFAAMRVRHNLLCEYPLKIEGVERHSEFLFKRSSKSTEGMCQELLFPVKRHSTVVESRRRAVELAGREHDARKRACVLNRTLQSIPQAFTGCSTFPTTSLTSNHFGTRASHKKHQLIIEQCYDPFFEPPVLLGCWTRTLLFCAPMAADMLPLRCLLYRDLIAAGEQNKAFVVVDVDVFHVDYVSYPPDRRCRLFGIRLRYNSNLETDEGCDVREAATRALQDALVKSAVEARLFPIWTHDMFSTKRHNPNEKNSSHEYTTEGGRSFLPHFHFEELDECVSAAIPNLVERRIFALAMAQRGPLLLTIGTPVVALRTFSSHIMRGTWCRVVRFVPINDLLLHGSLQLPVQIGSSCQRAADLSLARRYFHHQRGSDSLPVLQPILDDAEKLTEAMETVVLPAAMLVGGYRSLHYYALPTVQLPLLAPCQYAAASTFFHPLFAHEDNLIEFVSMESRAKAVEMMMMSPLSSLSPRRPGWFLCNAFFEDVEPSSQNTKDEIRQQEEKDGKAYAYHAMQSDVLSALSLFPSS